MHKGKKTHSVAFMIMVLSLLPVLQGDLTLLQWVQGVTLMDSPGAAGATEFLQGSGLSTVRAAIAKGK